MVKSSPEGLEVIVGLSKHFMGKVGLPDVRMAK